MCQKNNATNIFILFLRHFFVACECVFLNFNVHRCRTISVHDTRLSCCRGWRCARTDEQLRGNWIYSLIQKSLRHRSRNRPPGEPGPSHSWLKYSNLNTFLKYDAQIYFGEVWQSNQKLYLNTVYCQALPAWAWPEGRRKSNWIIFNVQHWDDL